MNHAASLRTEQRLTRRGRLGFRYIRPTAISTQPTLGVSAPLEAKLYVILCPVGPYYPEGFSPVRSVSKYACVRELRVAWRRLPSHQQSWMRSPWCLSGHDGDDDQ